MENRHDFEPDLFLTEKEWKKKGYKLTSSAKAFKGIDDENRYDCNSVCRLKPAKTTELTFIQWLEKGYVPKDGAFGREMHYYSRDGIFIYAEDEVEQNLEKVKAIVEERRKERNERQRLYRQDRKERRRELEELLDERTEKLNELRKSFTEKQEQFEKLTEHIRRKEYDIVEVAFDRYRSYEFIAIKELDIYPVGEKIYIPHYEDQAVIVGTRRGTLKYEVEYPYSFKFKHGYRNTDGTYTYEERYTTTEEAEAFEEQRKKDYSQYTELNDWCQKAEEDLWYGHY